MVKKALLQVYVNSSSGHLTELLATEIKYLQVVNQHLHIHLLSCVLVEHRRLSFLNDKLTNFLEVSG